MFEFDQYDRITDVLMYFTADIALKFTVVLAKYLPNGGPRRFYQYEVEKPAKTSGGAPTRNINRSMNFFFNIDIKDEFGGGFIIRPGDAYMLLESINRKVLPWFYVDSPLYAFQYVNETLAIKEFKQVIYTQSDIKHLTFEPTVISNPDDTFSFGVKMIINGMHSLEVTLEKFLEFVRYLQTDMYAVASSMTTYAKTQPYGVNIFRPQGLGGGRLDSSKYDVHSETIDLYSEQKQETSSPSISDYFQPKEKKKKGVVNSFLNGIGKKEE